MWFCLVVIAPPAVRAGPISREALQPAAGDAVRILSASLADGILDVVLAGDLSALRDDLAREDLSRHLLWAARNLAEVGGIRLWWQTRAGPRPLDEEVREPGEDERMRAIVERRPALPRWLPPMDLPLGGSLQGRTVALSPGHGWIYYDSLSRWSTQRGLINLPGCETCRGIIEDFSNAEIAIRYLIPDLLRAGAAVRVVRERDDSTFEKIIDDGDAGYLEEGNFRDGTSPGGYGDDYRVLLASDGGRARYRFSVPAPGPYWISLWTVSGSNRVSDARLTVAQAGREASAPLDLRANGVRWQHRLQVWLDVGEAEAVLEPGPEAEPAGYLVADAIRVGGGIDDSVVAGQAADKPRWQMGALTTLPYFGLPASLNPGSDVTVRPAGAEWFGADVYLSLHSNASGGSTQRASGTSTYRYNCGSYPDHSAAPDPSLCDQPPGSDRLQKAVHGSIVSLLRQRWDLSWRDRGTLVANFGELRPLRTMPGALVESAFHDGIEKASAEMRMSDNEALQDPRFRQWLAYAIYAGLTRFFDPDAELAPAEAPAWLTLTHGDVGGLRIAWAPVPDAVLYRVRWSRDGRALDRSLIVERTDVFLSDLTPGDIVAATVSGLNAGGEGPPSELAVARYRGHGALADLLLVAGFDRQDARIGDGHNRKDQAWAYAEGLRDYLLSRYYFDFASNEPAASGSLDLGRYRAAVWILGEESTAEETFSAEEQARVRAYLEGGGALLASGAEIGWDLWERGGTEDRAFFEQTFGAAYLSDDANAAAAEGAGPLVEIPSFAFDDSAGGIYPVEYPDVFAPAGGETVLEYPDGTAAAVAFAASRFRALLVGFPLETVVDPSMRSEVIGACLDWLLPGHASDDFDRDGLPDEWEDRYGTDPRAPSAERDPDGDGASNLEEYRRGTDPNRFDDDADGGADGGDSGDGGGDDDRQSGSGCGCQSAGDATGILGTAIALVFLGYRRRRGTPARTS